MRAFSDAPAARSSPPTLAANSPSYRYDVQLKGDRTLLIEAEFSATKEDSFIIDNAAARFVGPVLLTRATSVEPAVSQGRAWHVPCALGCRVRYTFRLGDAAESLNDGDTAIASGDAFFAPPSTWLLRPASAPAGARLEFHVDPGPGAHFASGFARAPGGVADTYVAAVDALDDSSFAAFGQLLVAEVPAGDTTVRLAVGLENLGLSSAQAIAWVAASAGAVATYYHGHLPARHALIVLIKGGGKSTRGETLGGGGPAVLVRASDEVTPATTRDDWVLTHELLHVNFPDLGRAHAWLSEGLATYVEPIARARVGLLDSARLWHDLIEGLPQGLPGALDRGLEHTHTWGRTYWGGALFCLVADLTLRERSGNAHSLDEVLRSIARTGANDEMHWDIEQFLDAGQKATGLNVLRELYEQMAEKPGTVDLAALFQRLGVRLNDSSVSFDEAAPLAAIRRSITAR